MTIARAALEGRFQSFEELAQFIENLPPSMVDMASTGASIYGKPEPLECGTPACIGGWACAFDNEAVRMGDANALAHEEAERECADYPAFRFLAAFERIAEAKGVQVSPEGVDAQSISLPRVSRSAAIGTVRYVS